MKAPGTIEDRNGRVRVRFTVKSGGRVVRPSYVAFVGPLSKRSA